MPRQAGPRRVCIDLLRDMYNKWTHPNLLHELVAATTDGRRL